MPRLVNPRRIAWARFKIAYDGLRRVGYPFRHLKVAQLRAIVKMACTARARGRPPKRKMPV